MFKLFNTSATRYFEGCVETLAQLGKHLQTAARELLHEATVKTSATAS